eukprot:Nk52_evm32s294 gene=Nk52_evmTU32s294
MCFSGTGVASASSSSDSKRDSLTANNSLPQYSYSVSSKMLSIIFLSLILDLIAFSSILPLFPKILASYAEASANATADLGYQDSTYVFITTFYERFNYGAEPLDAKTMSTLIGGFLGTVFCLGQFLVAPIAGRYADVAGRKPAYMISLLSISFSYFIWLISRSFTGFVLSRLLGGISKANISIALAMVSDVTSKTNRTKGMALVGIAFSVGFTVGPLFGAYMATKNITSLHPALQDSELFNPFSAAACFALFLSALNVVVSALFLKETKGMQVVDGEKMNVAQVAGSDGYFVDPCTMFSSENSTLNVINFVYFLYMFLFSGLEFTLSFLTYDKFNYSNKDQGKLYFFIGITMALFQVVVPSLTALTSLQAKEDEEGRCMGLFRSSGSLARGLSPICACSLYWKLGPELCFTAFAFLFAAPLFILLRAKVSSDPDSGACKVKRE